MKGEAVASPIANFDGFASHPPGRMLPAAAMGEATPPVGEETEEASIVGSSYDLSEARDHSATARRAKSSTVFCFGQVSLLKAELHRTSVQDLSANLSREDYGGQIVSGSSPDYAVAKVQMLTSAKTWEVVDLALVHPTVLKAKARHKRPWQTLMHILWYTTWFKDNSLVMVWIVGTLSQEIANEVLHKESAKDMWDSLAATYSQARNETRIMELHHDIHQMRQDGRPLHTYYSSLKSMFERLNSYFPACKCEQQKAYREMLMVGVFLSGLDSVYESAKNQMLTSPSIPPIDEAYSRLSRIPISAVTVPDTTSAMLDTRGRGYSCPLVLSVVTGASLVVSLLVPPVGLFVIMAASSSIDVMADGRMGEWIIDSGATHHITGDPKVFHGYKLSSGKDRVSLADGSSISVAGKVSLPLLNKFLVHNALHVPHIPLNLLSVSKIPVKECF
ncbi:hypothetical protein EJ110_NYTH30299 [Nymphaea thermarum]|nr:hypothetical protein EJ110_NYTH30299 [Nymphaea thermarum]